MSVHTSTVTTKGQTTVPGAIRAALGLQVGKMLVWELRPDPDGKQHLTVHPSPELDDLAGCLKSVVPFVGTVEETHAARKAQSKTAANREKRSRHR